MYFSHYSSHYIKNYNKSSQQFYFHCFIVDMQYDYAYMGIKLISNACTWAADQVALGTRDPPNIICATHRNAVIAS